MNYAHIKVGDKVEVSSRRKDKSTKRAFFVSQVISRYEHEKVFKIYGSFIQEGLLPKALQFECVFYTKFGIMGCDCSLVKLERDNDNDIATLRIISQFEKPQLREFTRYTLVIPVKYSLLNAEDDYLKEPDHIFQGVTKDLSSGGIKFLTENPLDETKKLRLMIEKKVGSMLAEGLILDQKMIETDNGNRFEVRVKFSAVSDSRRKHPRIPCALPLKYLPLDNHEKYIAHPILPSEQAQVGEIINMSEGGIKFSGRLELKQDDRLSIVIDKKGESLLAEGIVITQYLVGFDAESFIFETSVKFVSVTNNHRKYNRYDCFLPVKYTMLHSEKNNADHDTISYEGKILNISEGGIKIASDQPLNINDSLHLIIEKKKGVLIVGGIVIQQIPSKDKRHRYTYETGVKFIPIDGNTPT